ncbi:hypothetical protein CYMTET_52669 [Cymbomonas tetramitiformis]|uniref:Uncharacterized protein n=1 Tax=Cymbomonas tetramitiformis TaxID=36881 RepID=A0AAE0ESI1_9CHLO|nr:hypothetical protein CYMTET_52669 [Cymbomonas tetramitiformis]
MPLQQTTSGAGVSAEGDMHVPVVAAAEGAGSQKAAVKTAAAFQTDGAAAQETFEHLASVASKWDASGVRELLQSADAVQIKHPTYLYREDTTRYIDFGLSLSEFCNFVDVLGEGKWPGRSAPDMSTYCALIALKNSKSWPVEPPLAESFKSVLGNMTSSGARKSSPAAGAQIMGSDGACADGQAGDARRCSDMTRTALLTMMKAKRQESHYDAGKPGVVVLFAGGLVHGAVTFEHGAESPRWSAHNFYTDENGFVLPVNTTYPVTGPFVEAESAGKGKEVAGADRRGWYCFAPGQLLEAYQAFVKGREDGVLVKTHGFSSYHTAEDKRVMLEGELKMTARVEEEAARAEKEAARMEKDAAQAEKRQTAAEARAEREHLAAADAGELERLAAVDAGELERLAAVEAAEAASYVRLLRQSGWRLPGRHRLGGKKRRVGHDGESVSETERRKNTPRMSTRIHVQAGSETVSPGELPAQQETGIWMALDLAAGDGGPGAVGTSIYTCLGVENSTVTPGAEGMSEDAGPVTHEGATTLLNMVYQGQGQAGLPAQGLAASATLGTPAATSPLAASSTQAVSATHTSVAPMALEEIQEEMTEIKKMRAEMMGIRAAVPSEKGRVDEHDMNSSSNRYG